MSMKRELGSAAQQSQADRQRFDNLYSANYPDVYRFILRRIGSIDPTRAEDIAHETFLTAWRRLDSVPKPPNESKAWLYKVARGHLLHDQRCIGRRAALAVKIADQARTQMQTGGGIFAALGGFDRRAPDEVASTRIDLANLWDSLTAAEQEVIALVAWDDLTSAQAGQVLGISAATFRVRLTRARAAVRRLVASADAVPNGHPAANKNEAAQTSAYPQHKLTLVPAPSEQ